MLETTFSDVAFVIVFTKKDLKFLAKSWTVEILAVHVHASSQCTCTHIPNVIPRDLIICALNVLEIWEKNPFMEMGDIGCEKCQKKMPKKEKIKCPPKK